MKTKQKEHFKDRIFLNLVDKNKDTDLIKRILESPLGLSSKIISFLFEENIEELKNRLDKIKKFIGGIDRADSLADVYLLAKFYSSMFAFHQFFNSSFRARQGKALEEIIKHILRNYLQCKRVPDKTHEKNEILKEAFRITSVPQLDIDVIGFFEKSDKVVLIQMRSRDDTGGTTAKESLVDLLRALLRIDKPAIKDVMYLVAIWDERESQQKKSTITKMYSSLKERISLTEKEFEVEILNGVEIKDRVTLKLAYGVDNFLRALLEWTKTKVDKRTLNTINEVVRLIENWDDLWISYTLASLELEVRAFKGLSNIKLLNEKFEKTNSKFNFDSYASLVKSINDITEKIAPLWKENSIPLQSPSDQIHYIRDLLFLKACYKKNPLKKKVLYGEPSQIIKKINEPVGNYQFNVFASPTEEVIEIVEGEKFEFEPTLVSFRNLVPEITDTGYLTHSIYYYPAKFIPHVVKYCISNYTKQDEWVIDPFAGSGTVGLEAFIHERNAVLYDLNLLLNHIIPIKVYSGKEEHSKSDLYKVLSGFDSNTRIYLPTWENI